ncbi:MAG: bifunctional phosphoserine phosphatase/homoserine phosphotransferase ThrH [Chloroflexota bacterium]|nr:bifunctional phosphoserine phosphatase/homoserine phosphotransferase ThrH [Chloroflexota bacterium]
MRTIQPTLLASDLEGVLIPEIWVAVAEQTGIEQLFLTTRDIADYAELMALRLRVLAEHKLGLADIQAVVATMEPLPGAVGLLDWIRARTRLIVITDSFYEFITPLLPKLGYPTVFAHSLQTDEAGMIRGYQIRLPHGKRKAVHSLKALGFRVMAFGDSYNDTAMLAEADFGVLFQPPANVMADFPDLPVSYDYANLVAQIDRFLVEDLDPQITQIF